MSRHSALRERPESIEHAISILGIDGREVGDQLEARCPFHVERRPSFYISRRSGLWICHAGCGQGNLPQLAERLLGISGSELKQWTRQLGHGAVSDRDTPADVLDVVDEDAWLRVTTGPPAEALAKRQISADAARELGIRFNRFNSHENITPLRPGTDPCWMIPLRNPDGFGLMGWQSKGTITGQALTTGKKSRTLFGIELFKPGGTAILVESPLDVPLGIGPVLEQTPGHWRHVRAAQLPPTRYPSPDFVDELVLLNLVSRQLSELELLLRDAFAGARHGHEVRTWTTSLLDPISDAVVVKGEVPGRNAVRRVDDGVADDPIRHLPPSLTSCNASGLSVASRKHPRHMTQ